MIILLSPLIQIYSESRLYLRYYSRLYLLLAIFFFLAYPLDAATDYNATNLSNLYGTVNQNNVPVIGSEACGPTSAINSYTYLQNQNPLIYGTNLVSNTPIADVTVMGSSFYMNTSAIDGTWWRDYLWGKNLYMEYRVPLSTSYTARITDQGTYGSGNLGGWSTDRPQPAWVTITGNTTTAYDAWNFIYANLQNHADVGIGISYLPLDKGYGGHFLSVIGFSFTDTNGDKKIDKDENAQLTLMDPWTGQITTTQVWNDSVYGDYLKITYGGGAIIYVEMAENPGAQPVPTSLDPGNILLLRTTSTYAGLTLNGGVLLLGDPQVTWAQSFTTAAGKTSILNTAGYTCTLSGALTGSGNLKQMGSGNVIFQGNGTGFTGTYTVDKGTLTLDTNLGSTSGPCALILNYGGTMIGTGTLTGTITNSGTTNPGKSPGTLNVVGSYNHTSTGNLIAEIASPSNYDKVVVTGPGGGTASLAGTISPTLLGGYLPRINQIFSGIVQTTGGLTGTFATIANPRITRTLFWQPIYNPFSFDLKAVGYYTAQDLGLSSNQYAVGNMLNSVSSTAAGDLADVLDIVNSFTTNSDVQNAYQEISPQKYAGLPSLTFPVARMLFQQWKNRLAPLRWEAAGIGDTMSGSSGFLRGLNLNYGNNMLLASNSFIASDAGGKAGKERRWGVYLEPLVVWGHQGSTGNQTGYRYTNAGFTLGADFWLRDNLLVGLGSGYNHTATGLGGTGGRIDVNTLPVTAYAAFFQGGFYLNSALGYTYNNYDMARNINFGLINRTAQANTSGKQFHAAAETGYDFKTGKVITGPTVSLQYATLKTNAFTETNAGALNLSVAQQSASSLQSGVGARLAYQGRIGTIALTPQIHAGWQHEYSNNSRGLNARLAQGSSTMTFQTDRPKRDYVVVGADLTARVSPRVMARMGYSAELGRGNSSCQAVNTGLQVEF